MRRRLGLFFAVGFVLPLTMAASAAAQGSHLILTPTSAAPGATVTASSFGGYSTGANISNVILRLSTRNATPTLKSTGADAQGAINTTFVVPSVAPGTYLVLATQTNDITGRQRSFTPGRAKLRITAASRAGAASAPGGSTLPPAIWIGAVALIVLLGVSSTLTARKLLTLNRAGS